MSVAVVWFKRDLRVFDHLPLVNGSQHAAVLPLYVYEPEAWASSTRHWPRAAVR